MLRSRPMRVLFVIGTMGRGGAEIQVKDTALALVARGHAVAVVVLLPFLDFESELTAGGVKVRSLGLARGTPSASAVVALATFARRFRPDVVHAHMYAAIILARAVRCLPPIVRGRWRSLICTSHSRAERSRARYLVYRVTARLSEHWTSVSRDGLDTYRRRGALGGGAATYVPNGVDTLVFRPDGTSRLRQRAALGVGGAFVWVAVGSFNNDDKDQATLLRAFSQLVATGSSSRLLLAGDGVLLDEKRSLARDLGVEDRVRFLGMCSDVPSLLRAADAYVLSSQAEAMPIAILEASASALPVVTTDVGDCAILVEDGVGGFVVPPLNWEGLANAMLQVERMTDGERARMGANGRQRVEANFSLAATVNQWESLYRELCLDP
jgi:glycosyltransferase involved in cell wall biosynthesis